MSFKEFFYKCSLFLLRILRAITHPILVCKAKGKKQVLPPIKNDVLKISATDLARKIRRKELSSLEVCKAYIDRIQEVNPILNAVVEDRFELAIMDARNTDIYLSTCTLSEKELEETKPLLGVPLTVKESCCLKGLEYSVGHFPKAGTKAETDSEIVARLKASGAIPLLVSNNPELCMSIEAYNLITGTTNNPYDTTCTCGGSSGGEGALLGAGASVIGLGSDFAGSVRIPAAYNCVYGHKPTPRIASIKGHMPYVEYGKFKDIMVLGPMTRYVEDLKLMMNVIVDPGQTKNLRLNEKVDISKLTEIHDQQRNVPRFTVGQNIATTWTTKPPSSAYDTEPDFADAIGKWFNEFKYFSFGGIGRGSTGHYTQMIWADTNLVGCGYAYYYDASKGYTKKYVCNYGPGGNVLGRTPYNKGNPNCMENGLTESRRFSGLCEKSTRSSFYFGISNYIGRK